MKKIFLSLLLAAVLPLSLAGQKSGAPAGLTVISYNIRMSAAEDGTNSWAYRYPASAMMIDDQAPDIFGLQEALPDQMRYMTEILNKDYKSVGVGREDGKKEGECMGIFYRKKTVALLKWGTFWLSETPDMPSMGWDAACKRTATWALMKDKKSGKKFYYINTHLDHVGAQAQANGCQLIVDKIAEMNAEGLPVVVTGDFNLPVSAPGLAPMKKAFTNTRDVAAKTDDHFTYNGWGRDKQTIDYIWFKGFSSCTEFETVTKPYMDRTFISDHFPIKARLIF